MSQTSVMGSLLKWLSNKSQQVKHPVETWYIITPFPKHQNILFTEYTSLNYKADFITVQIKSKNAGGGQPD